MSLSFTAGKCPENTFTCDNSECITKLNPECDFITDCVDGSDEAFCCKCHHLAIMSYYANPIFSC